MSVCALLPGSVSYRRPVRPIASLRGNDSYVYKALSAPEHPSSDHECSGRSLCLSAASCTWPDVEPTGIWSGRCLSLAGLDSLNLHSEHRYGGGKICLDL